MKLPFSSLNNPMSFPEMYPEENKKDKEWYLKIAQAVTYHYKNGYSTINQSGSDDFNTLRAYAEGEQDTKDIQQEILGVNDERKGL